MINYFIKRTTHENKIFSLGVIVVLIVISIIPIYQTYGRLTIGGDTIIPLIPEFAFHIGYEWLDTNNGLYASNDYFSWVSIFYLLKHLGLSLYQAGFTLQFLIFFFSGLGLYKLYNLFNERSRLFGLIPAIAIIYSPHQYDHMIYFHATASIIWLAYFLFKFIKYKNITFTDVICISILPTFLGIPNPKYVFLVVSMYSIAIIGALFIKLISLKDIKANLKFFLLIFAMTTYLSLRFIYFGATFANDQSVVVKTTQEVYGRVHAMDFGGALVSQMIRLWHTPSLNAVDRVRMDEPLFALGFYAYPIIVLGLFPFILPLFKKEKRKVYFLFYLLALFFVFLSKSSNPPFGFFYDWMVLSAKVFAFMRTSAGMVIFAAIFYALIYGIIVEYVFINYRKHFVFLFFLCLLFIIPLFTGYNMWSGKYVLNHSVVNPYIDRTAHGLIVPQDYFNSAYMMEHLRLDTKVDIFFGVDAYQTNKWGYFGPPIYTHILDRPMVSSDKTKIIPIDSVNTNARYVYHDKSLYGPEDFDNQIHDDFITKIYASSLIDIYRKADTQFIPHFYVPLKTTVVDQIPQATPSKDGYKLFPTTYLNDQDKNVLALIPQKTEHPPFIEFKKINPTKYRIHIHKVTALFPLIFTENYHKEWKLYLVQTTKPKIESSFINLSYIDNLYKVFKNNEADQATSSELKSFINDGLLSSLGDMKHKTRNHYQFTNGKEYFDYKENYAIDFISKNFNGTIQNDNLPNGPLFETFMQKPVDNLSYHLKANGFSNSWIIDPEKLCPNTRDTKCTKNTDGTYDFELVAEFWPQRLAYIGYFLSGGIMFLGLFIGFFRLNRNK